MKHFFAMFGFVALLLLAATMAQQYAPTDTLEQKIEAVQYHAPFEIPGLFGRLFGDQRIQVTLYTESENELVAVVTKNRELQSIEFGELDGPTMSLDIQESTFNEIWEADNSLAAATDALNSGAITYEAHTVGTSVKMTSVSLFSRLFGWLL